MATLHDIGIIYQSFEKILKYLLVITETNAHLHFKRWVHKKHILSADFHHVK